MAQNITLMGASYSDVPSVTLPKTGGGTASFTDVTDTTAAASDVATGKYFYTAAGVKTEGTSSGGGGVTITDEANASGTTCVIASGGGGTPTQEEHEIYFEFSDSTNTTITGYWDDSFISNAITATTPTTYDSKTVTLAQLDGTTWYEVSSGIPLNTELIDFNAITVGYEVGSNGQLEPYQYYSASDYTPVEYGMTFTYRGAQWSNLAFYNSSKTFISSFEINSDGTSVGNNTCTGTLSGSKIPQNAAYVRIPASTTSPTSTYLSLIRTA